MKKVQLFMMDSCPHCRRALKWTKELLAAHPEYAQVEVEMIDERKQPEVADRYDYYYVPTYYVDGEKVHEGVASYEIVKGVYEKALGK